MSVTITSAVEGDTDEVVVLRLLRYVGAEPGPVYGRHGKQYLRKHIGGYNNAARHAPWLVLADLDQDSDCAPPLRVAWLPSPATGLCFRIAVRAVESWIMADVETLARFLGVARKSLPLNPDAIDMPKQKLVNLARSSRRRSIRDDMVPRQESGRVVGPAYSSRVIEFVSSQWRPAVAATRSESLQRAIACLRNLVDGV